jgi:HSP20 family molecular chaperone IbpA
MNEQNLLRSNADDAPVGVNAMGLTKEAQAMLDSIARRAYQLFESSGREHGHDTEHWLQAEAELFDRPPLTMAESPLGVTVLAEVPGFAPRELEVDLEPRRVVIIGKHQTVLGKRNDANEEAGHYVRQLLQTLELPVEVNPRRASAHLAKGILVLDLEKPAISKDGRSRSGTARHLV